jgi:hypothetical protein
MCHPSCAGRPSASVLLGLRERGRRGPGLDHAPAEPSGGGAGPVGSRARLGCAAPPNPPCHGRPCLPAPPTAQEQRTRPHHIWVVRRALPTAAAAAAAAAGPRVRLERAAVRLGQAQLVQRVLAAHWIRVGGEPYLSPRWRPPCSRLDSRGPHARRIPPPPAAKTRPRSHTLLPQATPPPTSSFLRVYLSVSYFFLSPPLRRSSCRCRRAFWGGGGVSLQLVGWRWGSGFECGRQGQGCGLARRFVLDVAHSPGLQPPPPPQNDLQHLPHDRLCHVPAGRHRGHVAPRGLRDGVAVELALLARGRGGGFRMGWSAAGAARPRRWCSTRGRCHKGVRSESTDRTRPGAARSSHHRRGDHHHPLPCLSCPARRPGLQGRA